MQSKDIVGVWTIQAFQMINQRTGERSEPWGEQPTGTVIFDSSGRMFALITPGGRSWPTNEAERASAFRNMLAYSGQYRVEKPNRLVTTVDIAWFEPWVGTEQIRYCDLDGDDLILTSAPLNMPQDGSMLETSVAVVTWRREISN